ncbi:protein phosphatase 1 regulatory subunit 3G [Scleropages formosus]|uniref:protein phosphatase 1 regulatory subunit 3G n=1 Tax=Scleropages formosus TaxID=113540 RepID=UPI0010FA69C9|nr:protein phosphatase 1 regulatory subunit 3G [Scleropages formosus]
MESNVAEVGGEPGGEPGDGQRAEKHAAECARDGLADSDDEHEEMLFRDSLRERRRAKSLPAYPEQARALEALSRRRCSGSNKSVRFADSLGFSLASVRHYSAAEEPRVPPAALSRLRSFPRAPRENSRLAPAAARLVPAFPMPVECGSFEGLASQRHVSLEQVVAGFFDVTGLIRVPAWCPATHVGVRYTFNEWLSFVDAQAVRAAPPDARGSADDGDCARDDCCDNGDEEGSGACQRFAFTMLVPPLLDASSSAVHFAVYCRTEQGEFWDNNGGHNYTLRYQRGPWRESADLE